MKIIILGKIMNCKACDIVWKELGFDEQQIEDVVEGVRDRDRERFDLQLNGDDWRSGRQLLLSNARDQAREGGVSVAEEEAEAAARQSARQAQGS